MIENSNLENKPIFDENEIMLSDEVIKILKISRVHLYRLLKDKKIPSIQIGRVHYFHRSKLNAWMLAGGKI